MGVCLPHFRIVLFGSTVAENTGGVLLSDLTTMMINIQGAAFVTTTKCHFHF